MAESKPSHDRRYLFWLALGTASLALVMAVLLVLQITQRRVIQTTGVVGVDSITALSFQFEREFLRFREVLESNVAGSTELDAEAIGMRYDILASRLGLLQDNPSIANLAAREEYKRVLPKILALFDRSDRVLAQEPLDRKALAELLAEFRAIGPEVQALSLAANSQVSRMLEAQEKQLLGQNQQIIVLTIVQMVVLLVAAAGLAIRQQRQERERAALESLTQDLQAAKQAAEAANLGKSQFLANMSHELRTPFNGMLGMLTLLETTPVNTQQNDYIQTAKGSANHLLMLLNDILDVSALDAGKITLKNEPLHLAAILKEVDDLMRPVATSKHIGFSITVLTDIPEWVLADSTRLKQILFNLVNNAIKFTEHGSVNITISKHPRTDGKIGLAFGVTDTGIGMDDQVLARLFQRFYQVDTGLARKFGGTGLGLEISQTLAHMMGGGIDVQSKPGQGSVFTAHMPFVACDPPTTKPLVASVRDLTMGGPALRVLVAEDHPVNRKFVGILLEKMGYTATFCENGQLAVDAARNGTFDLVLMDVHMPVMDGLAATRAIRELGNAMASVPIIALTADVMNEAKERASAAGVNDFVPKPVQIAQLQDAIRRCLPAISTT